MPSRFDVHVIPRSSRPGPDGRHGGVPRLRVKAAPTGGKANEEVERALTKILGSPASLVSGASSRRKTLQCDLGAEDLRSRLRAAFGD